MTVVLVVAAPFLLASFALQMEKLESRVLPTGGGIEELSVGEGQSDTVTNFPLDSYS